MARSRKSSERAAIQRILIIEGKNSAKNRNRPERPAYYDTPPYQPGGHYYEVTPEGSWEYKNRLILSRTYQPGDILKVDYIFGTYSEPVPRGAEVQFVGWMEYIFTEGDENLAYLPDTANAPGVYRDYQLVFVSSGGEKFMLGCQSLTLADDYQRQARLGESINQDFGPGLVRVSDLPQQNATINDNL